MPLNDANLTNTTSPPPFAEIISIPGYYAIALFFLLVIVPIQLGLNGSTILGLFASPTFRKAVVQRILLLGLTVAGLINSLSIFFYSVTVLAAVVRQEPSDSNHGLCLFSFCLFYIGTQIRYLYWATTAVVLFIIIRHGVEKVKTIPLTVTMVIMALIVVVSAVPFFKLTPLYFLVNLDGVLCFPFPVDATGIAYIAVVYMPMGLVAPLLAIAMLIATLVCVKKNTISGNKLVNRAMVKLAVLLLTIAIVILVASTFFEILIGYAGFQIHVILVWSFVVSAVVLLALPEIVIPVVMIAVFKPIRDAIWNMVTWKCVRTAMKERTSQTGSTNTGVFQDQHPYAHKREF